MRCNKRLGNICQLSSCDDGHILICCNIRFGIVLNGFLELLMLWTEAHKEAFFSHYVCLVMFVYLNGTKLN
jgi:hypothetical protein